MPREPGEPQRCPPCPRPGRASAPRSAGGSSPGGVSTRQLLPRQQQFRAELTHFASLAQTRTGTGTGTGRPLPPARPHLCLPPPGPGRGRPDTACSSGGTPGSPQPLRGRSLRGGEGGAAAASPGMLRDRRRRPLGAPHRGSPAQGEPRIPLPRTGSPHPPAPHGSPAPPGPPAGARLPGPRGAFAVRGDSCAPPPRTGRCSLSSVRSTFPLAVQVSGGASGAFLGSDVSVTAANSTDRALLLRVCPS